MTPLELAEEIERDIARGVSPQVQDRDFPRIAAALRLAEAQLAWFDIEGDMPDDEASKRCAAVCAESEKYRSARDGRGK